MTSHAQILRLRGSKGWNEWREENPAVVPDLRGSDFSECREHASRAYTFFHTNLRGAFLNNADLHESEFFETNLQDANLSNCEAWSAEFERVNLCGANLTAADLRSVHLANTDLRRANLRGAIVATATLENVRLEGADLQWTNFAGTVLKCCSFRDAVLNGTVFGDARLVEAGGLDACVHRGPSVIDHQTIRNSEGLPLAFLRGCGLPESYINYLPSLLAKPLPLNSCFISYSHADKQFARHLYAQLQDRGVRCFLDDHDLKPGDRILDAVDRAIRVHDKLLLCCSEAALTSWWVKDEIRKAQERERNERRDIIIPLNLDDYLLQRWVDGLASDLKSRFAPDFSGWESNPGKFTKALDSVVGALRPDRIVEVR